MSFLNFTDLKSHIYEHLELHYTNTIGDCAHINRLKMLKKIMPIILRQFSRPTCIIRMKEVIMIITAIILVMGSTITILNIQTVSAGPINTSRSNIKALRTDASGDNSQATIQNIDTEIIASTDNAC